LDRIDRQNGGDVRAYIAQLIVTGGASREQVAAKLKERYGEAVTVRSIRAWANGGDERLAALIRELEQIKASLADDDDRDPADLMRPTIDWDTILFDLGERFPAFKALMCHDPEAFATVEAPTTGGDDWAFISPAPAAAESDPEADPAIADALSVFAIIEDGGSPEEFESACLARLGVGSMDEWRARVERPIAGAGQLPTN
jgi:hypothetical protein